MFETILVPLDGSRGAESAVLPALDAARRFDASVQVLYVDDAEANFAGIDPGQRDELRRSSEQRGRRAIDRVHERATALGIDATRTVREGVPYRIILEYAKEQRADLIVMGTHGQFGPERVSLGSTTERVITLADVPVLAVPLTDEDGADINSVEYASIVIAVDGSDIAERAAERAFTIADAYDSTVYVTYVIDTTTYDLEDSPRSIIGLLKEGGQQAVEAIATEGRDHGISVKTAVRRGVPHEEIVEYADEVRGDLVVLGPRGGGGAGGDLLGSTTARVLRRTSQPILTIG